MAARKRTPHNAEVEKCIRNARRQPTGGYIRNALVSAATAQAVIIAKELFHHQMDHGRLMSHETTIPSPIGGARLRIRSRFRNDAFTILPPIVLVHGLGMGSNYWVPLGAHLAASANVYIPELPGHGKSQHDFRPLRIVELADALGSWMDQRGLRAAVLVGHSMGCQIVAELAVKRPELAIALVLLGPAGDPAAPTSQAQIKRAMQTSLSERKSLAVWVAMDFGRAGRRVLTDEIKDMIRYRFAETLGKLDIPVRVVRGEKDQVASQAWTEQVASMAGADRPIVVPNCAHTVQYADPKTTVSLILPFVRDIEEHEAKLKTESLSEEHSGN